MVAKPPISSSVMMRNSPVNIQILLIKEKKSNSLVKCLFESLLAASCLNSKALQVRFFFSEDLMHTSPDTPC